MSSHCTVYRILDFPVYILDLPHINSSRYCGSSNCHFIFDLYSLLLLLIKFVLLLTVVSFGSFYLKSKDKTVLCGGVGAGWGGRVGSVFN